MHNQSPGLNFESKRSRGLPDAKSCRANQRRRRRVNFWVEKRLAGSAKFLVSENGKSPGLKRDGWFLE